MVLRLVAVVVVEAATLGARARARDRIGPVIQRDPRLARIAPGVEPSFSGFEALLTESGMPPEPTPAQLIRRPCRRCVSGS